MKYQVIATMPTTGEVLLIENCESLTEAEEVARRFKMSLKDDWQVDIIPLNVAKLLPGKFADTMKANSTRQEKVKQQRAKDNAGILKSYRIKP